MKVVKPMNGHVFIRPLKETKQTGGLDLIAKYDEQDRYSKGEVVFLDSKLPLECCDIIMYDKSNGHGFQINDELLTVLHIGNVIGICES